MAQPMYAAPTPGPASGYVPPDLNFTKGMLTVGRIFAMIAVVIGAIEAIFSIFAFSLFIIYWILSVIISLLIFVRVGEVRRLTDTGQFAAAREALLPWMVLGFFFALFLGGLFLLLAYVKYDGLEAWQRNPMPSGPWTGAATAPAFPGTAPGYSAPYGTPYGAPPAAPPSGGYSPYAQPGPAYNPYAANPPPAASPQAAPTAATPTPAPPPIASTPMTACPRCGRPATWIPQYNRWYCYADQQYL